MAKDYGADRTVGQHTDEWKDRKKEVEEMQASGNYSEVYFSEKGGGYYAIEKSDADHKPEEIEAAEHMANAGYKVILIDEGGSGVSADGTVFNFVYEQVTPNPKKTPRTDETLASSVKDALEHGVEKVIKAKRNHQDDFKVDVAVIFDKHHSYRAKHIDAGITQFELYGKFRYKKIIVISKSGNVYEHYHNDI